MRYNSREEVEAAGRSGSRFEEEDSLPVAWVLNSFWLYCDPSDIGFTPHMTTDAEGFWEAWITLWMSQNVEPGSVCIDVGANMGYYTLFLLHHGCEVIAVEPQPLLADLIEKSLVKNNYVNQGKVDKLALADQDAQLEMLVPNGHGINASISYEPIAPEGMSTITVDVKTLNEYAGLKEKFDFVKVDIEGAEDKFFRGMNLFMDQHPNCVYLLEWRWDRLENPEQSAREIFDVMDVSYVGYDGQENPLTIPEDLATRQNEDWMLVLRRKP